MLLLYQVGSVKIGELIRFTVTYTPSHDRILPSPECLHLRIRNTCAIALRAAFVHGPYTLSASAYPSTYNPNEKFPDPLRYGVPEFEPMLKAGGTWNCRLAVPSDIRQSAGTGKHGYFGNRPEHDGESVSWVVEVASQVIFSTSAAVHYEILLARDEKSLNLSSGVPVIGGQAQVPLPGRVSDYQQGGSAPPKDPNAPSKGVFSRAIRLKVEDTASLWDKPRLPSWDKAECKEGKHRHRPLKALKQSAGETKTEEAEEEPPPVKQKKVHLVVLTHGLHSNLGSDMLYLKESIDAGVRQAKKDAKARKAKERAAKARSTEVTTSDELSGVASDAGDDPSEEPGAAKIRPEEVGKGKEEEEGHEKVEEEEEEDSNDDDDEEVIVRGFSGNATRTERGIKYLGKRLARFILSTTYPDQPFLPTATAASDAVSHTVKSAAHKQDAEGKPAHKHSTIHKAPAEAKRRYKFTKISFIGHSLGGLVQTYAVAYIQKHSPQFFDLIEPINFIALASPFLGLNHENPLYVKFALDFGLVGRTGQDLGLTWRAPTIARNGWGAIVSNLGENAHKHVYGEAQPESKPLLRILPTGPAHIALKKFRNRTLYSNVVNDGIVPLRTSCLLFLDWQGLGRVDKARREAGLVETVVRSGWAEITGANVTSPRAGPWQPEGGDGAITPETGVTPQEASHEVPQPSTNATLEDDRQSLRSFKTAHRRGPSRGHSRSPSNEQGSSTNNNSPFTGFFNLFRSNDSQKSAAPPDPKQSMIYQRSQTLKLDGASGAASSTSLSSSKSKATAGHELSEDSEGVSAPPTTTFFESAGDVLNPKLPTVEYLIDPSKRPRAIFHDRVYHPSDIPPPPLKRRAGAAASSHKSLPPTDKGVTRRSSSPYSSPTVPHQDSALSKRDYDDTEHTNPDMRPDEEIDASQMRVEEKIARAYHRGLSWRKVLVKLEPDAHNNIIVRRMFANAYGWPVIHHLVEAHFSDSAIARAPDDEEPNSERAKPPGKAPDAHGSETKATTTAIATPKNEEGTAAEDRGRHERPSTPTVGGSDSSAQPAKSSARTESEDREATDTVPELPRSPSAVTTTNKDKSSNDHLDTGFWSDRDWADSAAESEDLDAESPIALEHRGGLPSLATAAATAAASHGQDGSKGKEASTSPGSWSWTEKIVGKGAAARPQSPLSPGAGQNDDSA